MLGMYFITMPVLDLHITLLHGMQVEYSTHFSSWKAEYAEGLEGVDLWGKAVFGQLQQFLHFARSQRSFTEPCYHDSKAMCTQFYYWIGVRTLDYTTGYFAGTISS